MKVASMASATSPMHISHPARLALAVGLALGASAQAAPPHAGTALPEPRALVTSLQPRDVATLAPGSLGAGLAVAVQSASTVTLDLTAIGTPRQREVKKPQGRESESRPHAVGAQRFALSLPGESAPLIARVRTTYEFLPGVFTHVGAIEGREDSAFSLAIDTRGELPQAIAKVHLGNRLYVLSPEGTGHTLIEIDKQRVPQVPEDMRLYATTPKKQGEPPELASSKSSSGGNVRILALYTPTVGSSYSIGTFASAILGELNDSLTTSAVDSGNYFSLAGSIELNSNFTNICNVNVREQARLREYAFEDFDDWMAQEHADIALVLIAHADGTSSCATNQPPPPAQPVFIGRVGGIAGDIRSSDHPFAIVNDTYALGDLTAPHEIGHVLGGIHHDEDEYAPGTLGTLSYARGFAEPGGEWMTIMGTYSHPACWFNGLSSACVRLPRWSNPDLQYDSQDTGEEDWSDMTLALDVLMPEAADWTGDPAPPATPSSFNVYSQTCWGYHDADWSASTSATEYRLFGSDTWSFATSSLLYQGTSLSTFVNVPSDNAYLRVQACNGAGCSAPTAPESAVYVPYCM